MKKKITSALISVYYKDGLENIIELLHNLDIKIYSTGGTQKFIEERGIPCIAVESLTSYPSILNGRVKTLHPSVFGGILAKRDYDTHVHEMKQYNIPEIDLVIVDLYPFEETVKDQYLKSSADFDETLIIEKIDVGGPSMMRAAAKNFNDVLVIASKQDYAELEKMLTEQNGETTIEQRRIFAVKAFNVCTGYDIAISNYFNETNFANPFNQYKTILRYGENPHQEAVFYGELNEQFEQLNGKELSYNNLVDVDAAINLIADFEALPKGESADEVAAYFAIIKHTNVCGVALRPTVQQAWQAALHSDPESAFGGVLVTDSAVDNETAFAISEIFFEVLIAPAFKEDALEILQTKKNRIILQKKQNTTSTFQFRSVLNGSLTQKVDAGNFKEWKEVGGRISSEDEKKDLKFGNIICKHLKSNAIALVKDLQLIGKGCGQTSRVDALRQAIQKANQFNFNLSGALLASDAFFPFDDCVKIAHASGITAYIQPGGSIRDKDSIDYCMQNNLAMVITGLRHFKH